MPNVVFSPDSQNDGALGMGFKPTGINPRVALSAKTTTEFTRVYNINNSNTTVTDINISYGSTTMWLIDLDTMYLYEYEGDTNPPYEPYTGREPSPNANYPQPIENASNISVELSGINLFNKNDIDNRSISVGDTEFTTSTAYSCAIIPCKPNTNYIKSGNLGAGTQAYLDKDYTFIEPAKAVNISVSFTTPQDCAYIVLSLFNANAPYDDVQLVEGTVAKPYEPYLHSLVNTDLTLNKIDFEFNNIQNTAKDIFNLDYIQKKAILKKNIAEYNLGDLADADFEPISSTNQNYVIFAIKNLKRGLKASNNFGYGYCNRCKWQTEANPVITEGEISIGVHSSTELWLYISTSLIPYTTSGGYYDSTVADLRAFLTQYPINICYVMNREENIPVTGAWVNDLLNLPTINGTNIITINGDINPTNTSITYAEWGGKYEA
jgi:hypothetical protein